MDLSKEEEGYIIELIEDGYTEDDIVAEVLHYREYLSGIEEFQESVELSQEGIIEFDTHFVFEPWEIEEYFAYERYRKEMSGLP